MRLTAKILVAAATMAFLICWALEVAENVGASLFPELRARGDEVARKRKQRDNFHVQVVRIAHEVADGRLSLREASRRMEAAAAEHWPTFLKNAEMIDAPGTLRAKLAYNLLLHLQYEMPSVSSARLGQITDEYQAIAAEEPRGP